MQGRIMVGGVCSRRCVAHRNVIRNTKRVMCVATPKIGANLGSSVASQNGHLKNGNSMNGKSIVIGKQNLGIEDVVQISRFGGKVSIQQDDLEILQGIQDSREFIDNAMKQGTPIYGVTTGFGGKADTAVPPEQAVMLQHNLLQHLKVGTGGYLPLEDVRAAMMIRVKSHLHGVSGIRMEIVQRMITFLNSNVTPHVHEYGSIGASGDLCPLAYVTGSLIGENEGFTVDFDGQQMDCLQALQRLNLEPVELLPKEGLAMVNGTSVMAATATNCVYDVKKLLWLTLAAHALMYQGLCGSNQSLHPFIHQLKPHNGQIWAAQQMYKMLEGSKMARDEQQGLKYYKGHGDLIQDRYSIRCLPQYMGPIVDGILQVERQVEVEINSATDNPLIDADNAVCYHGGNFLGKYIGVSMDQLRHYIGLMAKHLDAQIALLIAPQFNNGLSAALVGNEERAVNMGLKGLQTCGNSIMPLLLFYGNSIVDKFPTHAEQFNQNINSQGFNAANLTRKSIDIFYQYISLALIFAVQSVDLRTKQMVGHYDARDLLSEDTIRIYEAVREVLGSRIMKERPFVWNDDEQQIDHYINQIHQDLKYGGKIFEAVDRRLNDM